MSRWFSLKSIGLAIVAVAFASICLPQAAFAQLEGPSVSTGYDYATQVAYNPATHFAYITNWDAGTNQGITQIDTMTGVGTKIALCASATAAFGITVNPVTNMVYTANWGTGTGTTVSVFTGATDVNGTITNAACTTNVTVPAGAYAINVNPVTNVIYVTGYSSGEVTAINGTNNTVINSVTGFTASSTRAIAINPVNNYVFVAYGTTSPRVATFTGATNTGTQLALKSTITSNQDYPSQLSVNPVTNEVYVANCYYLCSDGAGGPVATVSYFAGQAATSTASNSTTKGGEEVYNVVANPVTNTVYWGNWDAKTLNYVPGATNGGTVGTQADATATNYQWETVFDSTHNFGTYDAGGNGNDWYPFTSAGAAIGTGAAQGADPITLGLDPITSRVMMANWGTTTATPGYANTVTLSAAVTPGTTPAFVAVNPVSGNVYVANSGSASISAYNSALTALSGSPITVGTTPVSIAVDPVTATVYVANKGASPGTMTVIDENSSDPNVIATVTVGTTPVAVAVNPVTNMVYVANNGSNNVSVYNESTGAVVATIALSPATTPYAIAIDQGNNNIYVADANGYVSQINGGSNTLTATLTTGSQTGATNQQAIAVNPITHAVYVANAGTNSVTYFSGCPAACAANTITLTSGGNANALTVNPTTGDVYVAQNTAGFGLIVNNAYLGSFTGLCTTPSGVVMNTFSNLAIMTCSGTKTSSINGWDATGLHAGSAARYITTTNADPVAGGIAINNATQTAYVITSNPSVYSYSLTYPQSTTLVSNFPTSVAGSLTDPDYVPNDQIYATTNTSPTFTVTAATTGYANQYQNIPVTGLYYILDNPASKWTPLTSATTGGGTNSTTWTVNPTGLSTGVHTLYVFGTYGDEGGATTNGIFYDVSENANLYQGTGTNPNIGPITSYPFVILANTADTTTTLVSSANPSGSGQPVTFTATVTPETGTIPTSDSVSFFDGVTLLGTVTPLTPGTGNVTAAFTTSSLTAGNHYITACFSGDSTYTWSCSAILTQVVKQAVMLAMTSPTSGSPTTQSWGLLSGFTVTGTASWTFATAPTAADLSFTSTAAGTFTGLSCPVTASPITCTATFTPTATDAAGSYNINLTFSGDTNYAPAATTQAGNYVISPATLSSIALAAVTPGSPSSGVTSSVLNATISPAINGVSVTFTDTTTGNVIGTALTSGGVASITANTTGTGSGQSSPPSGGLNNFTAQVAATANYSAVGPSSPVTPVYYQGLLFSLTAGHDFSVCYTNNGTGTPVPCAPYVSGNSGGTLDGSQVCGSGIQGYTCTAAFGITVFNFTSSAQTLAPSLVNPPSNAFSSATNCPASLAAGATCQYAFYYRPPYGDGNSTTAGLYEAGSWSVAGNAGTILGIGDTAFDRSGPATFPATLSGYAVLPATNPVSVTPLSLTFGPQAAGAQSATQNILVTNNGTASIGMTYTPPVPAGFIVTNGCPTQLSQGASCTIGIAYKSSSVGTTSGYETITPAGASAIQVAVSGTVVSNVLSLSTAAVNMGGVNDGSTATRSVTLTNNSASAATISFGTSGSTEFTYNYGNCGSSLGAGASCTVSATFAPTAAGAVSNVLTVTSSIPVVPGGTGSGPYTGTVTFSGTGVAAGGNLTVSTSTHNFGNVSVDSTGSAYGVTMTNNTGASVTLAFGSLSGTPFTAATNCGSTLANGASCQFVFNFTPTTTGFASSTYTITANGGAVPVYSNAAGGDVSGITLEGTGVN